MKLQSLLKTSTIALMLAGGLGLTAGAALAQGADPLDDRERSTSDPFSNWGADSGNSTFFDLMHRVQLGNIRSNSEFSKDQQESLGSTADDFRTRQREALQQNQAAPQPVTPEAVTTPSATPEAATPQ